jgi:hypothetical protein
MKQIRHSAFETNSSSAHSITIAYGGYDYDEVPWLLVDENGVCNIYPGEFGWEVEHYNDPTTKASYCLTWLKHYEENEKHGHQTKSIEREKQMFIDVIKRVTGATEVKFVPAFTDEGKTPAIACELWGYIDHQSIEDDGGALTPVWKSEETLESFIFNPQSVLYTDNDNH